MSVSFNDSQSLYSQCALFLHMLPILFSTTIDKDDESSDNQNQLSFVLWFLSLLFFIIGVSVTKPNISHVYSFIIGSISSLIIISKLNDNHADLSYYKEQLPIAEKSVKSEMSAFYSQELRHMIGNFAHDLKTPLAGLRTSIDLVFGYIQNLKHSQDKIQLIMDDSLQSLNVNYFIVLMVINRYIDYVKATKSVKINPYFESFTLKVVLEIPLSYMKHILENDQFTVPEWTSEIANDEIQSDKRWIYENLLCFLLNSTKFCSAKVNIMIDISNVDISDINKMRESRDKDSVFFGYDDYPESNIDSENVDEINSLMGEIRPSSYSTIPNSVKNIHKFTTNLQRFKSIFPHPTRQDLDPNRSSTGVNERFIKVEVKDNGIGLSKSVLKALFEPCCSTEQALSSGGSGIGLYVVASRVKALKGYYGASNRHDVEHGSTFWFAFPYIPTVLSAVPNYKYYEEKIIAKLDSKSHDENTSYGSYSYLNGQNNKIELDNNNSLLSNKIEDNEVTKTFHLQNGM
eukprot:gene15907-21580_t